MVLPKLRSALSRVLARYPECHVGLSDFDHQLLRNARTRGPKAAYIIGDTMGDGYDCGECVGDGWLYWRLRRLASAGLAHPLVRLSGSHVDRIRGTEVFITDAGTAVLDGDANFVALNGINDWVLGVHLDSSSGRVWFRDEEDLQRGPVPSADDSAESFGGND